MTDSSNPTSRQEMWGHGGYMSVLVTVLVFGGLLITFVWEPWVGVALSGLGVALGIYLALHPVNRPVKESVEESEPPPGTP